MKTGVSDIIGRGRTPSEDRSFVRELSGEILIAGVLDGHSGSFTVECTVRKLPDALIALVKTVGTASEDALRAGLRAVFINHDKLLANQGGLSYRDSGCTATIVIITPKICCFAYIGDSPACVFNPDTGLIYGSIGKHEPSAPIEKARIEKNGGEVTTDDGDAPRVNGCLMVSRAFGDFSMKFKDPNRPTEAELAANWSTGFCVVAEPDIVIVPRPEKGLVAIFSDGLVETADAAHYRTYQEVVNEIRETMKSGTDLTSIASACLTKQVARFTDVPSEYDGDDITLLLINCDRPIVTTSIIGGAPATVATTRRHKSGHRRTRSSKKKLAKSFYI